VAYSDILGNDSDLIREVNRLLSCAVPCHPCAMANERKNAAAVALGRLGGLKGGKARARKLTTEQRRESARKAAQARWSKQKS
jgi:hypothetical protein